MLRLERPETGLSPPVKYFSDHYKAVLPLCIICCLCPLFVMLWLLFFAALWSPEGKGPISWLLFVMFIVILLLSHLVFWDRSGT